MNAKTRIWSSLTHVCHIHTTSAWNVGCRIEAGTVDVAEAQKVDEHVVRRAWHLVGVLFLS